MKNTINKLILTSLILGGIESINIDAAWFKGIGSLNPFSWKKWKNLNDQDKKTNFFQSTFAFSTGIVAGAGATVIANNYQFTMAVMAPHIILSLLPIVSPTCFNDREKTLRLAKENCRTMYNKASWDKVDTETVPTQDVYSHQQNVQRAKALRNR